MSTSSPRRRKKLEGAIMPPVGPRKAPIEENVAVPRSFLRLCKLTPIEFRVLMNGITYNGKKYDPMTCAKNIGMSITTVRRALDKLQSKGYAILHEGKWKFYLQPVVPDEEKPWFKDMMRLNNGDVDGVVYESGYEEKDWTPESYPSSRKIEI